MLTKNAKDVKPSDLSGDSDGRVNILLMGMGGEDHPGGTLTDTIQVLSLDTQNHKAGFLSVPRDLYYKYSSNTYARINEMYYRGELKQKGNGTAAAKQTISDLLGIPIHYYVLLDFQAFKEIVDSLGGITVTVDTPLDDPFYPAADMIRYSPVHIKAGTQTMDGETALKYARSRKTTSDFDRSRRQQEVMLAIKQKALSAGVLTNPVKLTQIMNIVGNHIRTDLQVSEMQTLITEVKDLTGSQIITQVIDSSASGPLVGQNIGGADVLVPRDGDYTYQAVKDIAHTIFTNPFLAKEDSTIAIQNATSTSGLGATVSKTLKNLGYNVVSVTNSTTKEQFTQLIDRSGGKNPFTISFLEKRFGLKARQDSSASSETADIVLILGADYSTSK